jgi:hypothetical protein
MHSHILREAHRLEHLRSEHATVTNLDPLLQSGMVGEDFQRGLEKKP